MYKMKQEMMFIKLFIIVAVGVIFFTNRADAKIKPFGNISGVILDRITLQPIVGAKITVKGLSLGVISDVDGKYIIKRVPVGRHVIVVTITGYKRLERGGVIVGRGKTSYQKCELYLDNTSSSAEIEILGRRFTDTHQDFVTSSNSYTSEELRWSPSTRDDPQRAVLAFPGVTISNDNRNDLIARGGNPQENFIMIDGIEVPNINNFGTQGSSGGQLSMLQLEFIESLTFSTGGFSAKYGGKLSSAMDITYRNGDPNNWRMFVDFGFSGVGIIAEAPLFGKGSILVSARRSFLEILPSTSQIEADQLKPIYWNANAKANYQISSNHLLSLLVLWGLDAVSSSSFSTVSKETTIAQENSQYVIGLTHKWLLSKESYLRTSLSYYDNNFSNTAHRNLIIFPSTEKQETKVYMNNGSESGLALRSDFSSYLWGGNLEAGLNFKYLPSNSEIFFRDYFAAGSLAEAYQKLAEDFSQIEIDREIYFNRRSLVEQGRIPGIDNPTSEQLADAEKEVEKLKEKLEQKGEKFDQDREMLNAGRIPGVDRDSKELSLNSNNSAEFYKAGVYFQYTKSFFDRISITPGIRLDYFSYSDEPVSISPRFSTTVDLTDYLKASASWGLYHQAPSNIWILAFKEENNNLKQIESMHTVLGLYYYPITDLKISLEGFYKTYAYYPTSSDKLGGSVTYANTTGTFGGNVPVLASLVDNGAGIVKGIEVSIRKRLTEWVHGIVSYSLSQAENSGSDGVLRPSSFDNTHILNAQLGVAIPVLKWMTIEFSADYRYSTGGTYTPLETTISKSLDLPIENHLGMTNTGRFNDYHRLNLKIGQRLFIPFISLSWYVSVENIYDRKNQAYVIWDGDSGSSTFIHQSGRQIAGGILIEF